MENKAKLLQTNKELIIGNNNLKSERSGLTKQNQNLTNNIRKKTQELSEIEAKIGDETKEGTLKYTIKQLKINEAGHNETLKKLKEDISEAQKELGMFDENGLAPKGSLHWEIDVLNKKIYNLEKNYEQQEAEINTKVNIIKTVKDFKEESVKNMKFYGWSMVGVMLMLVALTGLAVWCIMGAISMFETQQGLITTNLLFKSSDFILSAISIAIVKAPIAILFIGGMFLCYKLFLALFKVYEKINSEKRKISTIEALINHLNEKSVAIVNEEELDFDDPASVKLAKDKIKWGTISKYFESLPNDNLQNDNSIKAENDLFREIFIKSKKTGSITTPIASVAGSTETGK